MQLEVLDMLCEPEAMHFMQKFTPLLQKLLDTSARPDQAVGLRRLDGKKLMAVMTSYSVAIHVLSA